MKIALIITVVFSLIFTLLLIESRNQGLHPNMKAFGLMIPAVLVFVWAKINLFKAEKAH